MEIFSAQIYIWLKLELSHCWSVVVLGPCASYRILQGLCVWSCSCVRICSWLSSLRHACVTVQLLPPSLPKINSTLFSFSAEAAHLLIRNVNYEIPSLKRQIGKCQQTQRVRECFNIIVVLYQAPMSYILIVLVMWNGDKYKDGKFGVCKHWEESWKYCFH